MEQTSNTATRGKQYFNEIRCVNWRPCRRNTLRGFAQLLIPTLHLVIDGVAVHELNGKTWAQLPACPQLNEKQELVLEGDKIRYRRALWFDSRDLANQFGTAVVVAVKKHNGGQL